VSDDVRGNLDLFTFCPTGTGATENAGVEKVIRSKLQGWKMQEWKKREQIAGVENARVSRMERQPEILLRQP